MVALVFWRAGLVKVILTGDRCGGSELAMLCMMLLILGLPLTGTVMFLDTCGDTLVTSFSIMGDELDELVRRRFRGFSSSSEQLTPVSTVANHSYGLQTVGSHIGKKKNIKNWRKCVRLQNTVIHQAKTNVVLLVLFLFSCIFLCYCSKNDQLDVLTSRILIIKP